LATTDVKQQKLNTSWNKRSAAAERDTMCWPAPFLLCEAPQLANKSSSAFWHCIVFTSWDVGASAWHTVMSRWGGSTVSYFTCLLRKPTWFILVLFSITPSRFLGRAPLQQ